MGGAFENYGKELIVGTYGKFVGLYRNEAYAQFSIRWLAVFSTLTDCSGAFDWSQTTPSWPAVITLG